MSWRKSLAMFLFISIALQLLIQPTVGWYGFRVCFEEIEGSSQCQGSRRTCSGKLTIALVVFLPSNKEAFLLRDWKDDRMDMCEKFVFNVCLHVHLKPNVFRGLKIIGSALLFWSISKFRCRTAEPLSCRARWTESGVFLLFQIRQCLTDSLFDKKCHGFAWRSHHAAMVSTEFLSTKTVS